jgi:glycosyltransferase involved in cell wall biosynthesis
VGVLRNKTLIRLSEWLEKFIYHNADKLVVNSPGFIEHIQKRGGKKISLVENGVDAEMFNPLESGETFRQAHGLEGKFIALYAGAHGMSNDLEVLLRAAEHLMDEKEITLLLVGDGKEKNNLMNWVKERSLNNVRFVPSVAKNEMNEVLAAADACIAILKPIELYKTTYPNKVFDYMAAGKPVLLLIDGVIREVVEQADCGWFITPGDDLALANKIKEMRNHRADAKRKGQNGRDYAQNHFDRKALTRKLENLFRELINEKTHPDRGR